jgi:hypothetical protein
VRGYNGGQHLAVRALRLGNSRLRHTGSITAVHVEDHTFVAEVRVETARVDCYEECLLMPRTWMHQGHSCVCSSYRPQRLPYDPCSSRSCARALHHRPRCPCPRRHCTHAGARPRRVQNPVPTRRLEALLLLRSPSCHQRVCQLRDRLQALDERRTRAAWGTAPLFASRFVAGIRLAEAPTSPL